MRRHIFRVEMPFASIAGVWGWQVGRAPQAPRFRPEVVLVSFSAIFFGKLEMLIHAPFKILLQGQIL
jgi:hypothetical protein